MNFPLEPQQKSKTIDEWAQVLCEQEMPIFSNTASNIYSTLDDEKKGAMEIASIILQDPNLTAKLLKVSNSSYYNPSRQKLNTVSRAIVILGAETIRELTIACSFFESILCVENKERANQEIGAAIHAAVQAKALAIMTNDPSPEEVFIAALLHNIGHISFWCFSQKQGVKITELMQSGEFNAAEAEKQVLGFTLQQLAKKLSKSWRLGKLIEQAISDPNADNQRVRLVKLGHDTSDALQSGWDSEAMQNCIKTLTELTNRSTDEIETHIRECTDSAIKIARQFGAHDASRFIDSTAEPQPPVENEPVEVVDKKDIQFQVLQEITDHISGKIDLNVLFEQVLEGIHRGIGMDRTLFMMLGTNKKILHKKFSIGWQASSQSDKMDIYDIGESNLFFNIVHGADSLWANQQQHSEFYDQQITDALGQNECFVLPIQTKTKVIGLIYCDRFVNQEPFAKEEFNSAKHFTSQATIGLTLYSMSHI